MKKLKFIPFVALAGAAVAALASCGKAADYKVGILQLLTHDALDKATEGFKEEINKVAKEKGKTVEFVYQNPENDSAAIATMATKLVRSCNLVMGNATPAATALKSAAATEGKTDLPILFTSVTDPVDAKLVASLANPGGNVTGTSDINPIGGQMELVADLLNKTDFKLGFFYSADESNSKAQCDQAEAYVKAHYPNAKTETSLISSTTEISATATALCSKVDAIYIPTDNRLAGAMSTVTNATNAKKTPVICGEKSMVDNGGTVTVSISYKELGKTTGEMACDILFNGKKPNEISVKSQTEASKFEFALNANYTQLGITLSDAFKTKYNVK